MSDWNFLDLNTEDMTGEGWTEEHRTNYTVQSEALGSEAIQEAVAETGIATSAGNRGCVVVLCGRSSESQAAGHFDSEEEVCIGVKKIPNADWDAVRDSVKELMIASLPTSTDEDSFDWTHLAEAWLWVKEDEIMTVSAGPYPALGWMMNVFSLAEGEER